MEHLNAETLGRLVDEAPTDDEGRHLEACAACSAELEELREQTLALGALPDLRPPPGDWEVLQARMVSEGLIRWAGRQLGGGLATTPPWMRVAAGVLLFLGGAAGGLAVRGPVVANFTGAVPGGAGPSVVAQASSPEEAAEVVRMAERQYMDALVQYRQFHEARGESSGMDPAARFAAIEYLVRASQAAVREVPADPFLNGFLASVMAEREAQLRRISATGEDQWF